MKQQYSWMALLGTIAVSALAQAGEVKLTWQDPEKYTDIRPSNETRDGFQARVIQELGAVFASLAKKLPDGVTWDITVTDIDLAGEVRPMMYRATSDIRVVKDFYWPRVAFSYVLTDAQGRLIGQGKEDLKDMSFMFGGRIASGRTSFQYEERMLQDWFKRQQRDKLFPTR